MVQHWQEIKSPEWLYDSTELLPTDTFSVKFRFDQRGRVTSELNLKRWTLTNYEYDSVDRLVRKLAKGIDDGQVVEEWAYKYKNGKLASMRYLLQDHVHSKHFFSSNGLIDSSSHDSSYMIKYLLEYFEE